MNFLRILGIVFFLIALMTTIPLTDPIVFAIMGLALLNITNNKKD